MKDDIVDRLMAFANCTANEEADILNEAAVIREQTIDECAKVAERFYKECRDAAKHYAKAGDGSDTQCLAEALIAKEIEIAIRAITKEHSAAPASLVAPHSPVFQSHGAPSRCEEHLPIASASSARK